MSELSPEALDTIEAEIEQMAEAMALAGDEDGCFERVKDWEALEQWEKDAHPDERPHGDYEDCEYWRVKAGAAYAVVQPELRRLRTENEEAKAIALEDMAAELDRVGWSAVGPVGQRNRAATIRAALTGEATEPAPIVEPVPRCPRCRHMPHGRVCFNMASDNDCSCKYGIETGEEV